MTFEVIALGVVVGTTDLETGDPPMGVASGAFKPTDAYSGIREKVLRAQGDALSMESTPEQVRAQEELNAELSIRATDGSVLEPCSHVHIVDLQEEVGELEVSILGLDSEVYERYFPHHVEAYRSSFK